MQNYNIDIHPTDKACVHWWDKEEHEPSESTKRHMKHKPYAAAEMIRAQSRQMEEKDDEGV